MSLGIHGLAKHKLVLSVALVAVVALMLVTAAQRLSANREVILFDDAEIFIELNATDEDSGLQIFLDGEGWEKVTVVGPDRHSIFEVNAKGGVGEVGITELAFESAEPGFEDLPLDEFLELFPEGEYRFLGKTVEGDRMMATATLTHNIPDGPAIISPEEDSVQDPDDIVISWEAVTTPAGIEIVGYQVIVEREDPLRIFSVDLPATDTSVTVPSEFFEPETEYQFEILAIEESGNKTITESSFETE